MSISRDGMAVCGVIEAPKEQQKLRFENDSITTGRGKIGAFRGLGLSEALHDCANTAGVDISIDWDKSLLYETAYFKVTGNERQVEYFIKLYHSIR